MTGTYLGDRRDEDFGKVNVDEKDWAIHCHILGRSGMGKSWLMRQMLAEDIKNNSRRKGAGLCLIDPAGDLYDYAFECVSADKVARKRLHLIDFSQKEYFPCLSYFDQAYGMDTDAQCRQIVYALQKVFKQADEAERVQMNKIFSFILPLCKHAGLTFEEIPLLASTDPQFRNAVMNKLLTENLINPSILIQWRDWNSLNRDRSSEFIRLMDSIISRVTPFLSLSKDSNTSYLFNQDKSTIDFKQAMEERHIVLCKMPRSSGMDEKLIDFFGTIIVDKILNAGYSRDLKNKNLPPFRVYIDEFSRFVSNRDLEQGLNEMRKFRVSFVLAHQNLDQLKQVDESLYKSVKSNCNVRILFSSDDEDAEVAAKSMFTQFLARDIIQDELETQMIIPVEETRRIVTKSSFESYAESVMNSTGGGSSTGSGTVAQYGSSSGTSLSYGGDGLGNFFMTPDAIGSTATETTTSSTAYSSMSTQTDTWARGDSESWGGGTGISESVVPFYKMIIGKQVTSRQFYSQADKIAQLVHMIVSQSERHAFIQVGRSEPIPFIVATVKEPKGATHAGQWIAQTCAYEGDEGTKGNNSGLTKKAIEEQWARRDGLKRAIMEEYGHRGLSIPSGGAVDAEYEVLDSKPRRATPIPPLSVKNVPKKKSHEEKNKTQT